VREARDRLGQVDGSSEDDQADHSSADPGPGGPHHGTGDADGWSHPLH
jgi:hypothetical protein